MAGDTSLLIAIYTFLIGLMLALGILLAFMPYLMRRQECFSVTIPATAADDPYLRALKRRFAIIMATFTLALFASATLIFFIDAHEQWDFLDWFLIGSDVLLFIAYYALMQVFRKKVLEYKSLQGWHSESQRTSATIGEQNVAKVGLRWNLLYLLMMGATLLAGILAYPYMPESIPMNIGLDGTVTNWAEKGPGMIAFPVVMEGFLGLCFAASHLVILRSRKWTDPSAPATSALAYGLYARAWSIFSLVFGLLLSSTIGAMFLLSALEMIPLSAVCIGIFFVVILMIASAIALSVVYGQVGSRVFKRMQVSGGMPEDTDEYWKAGLFYFNPGDASIFLPERFGIGWTLNWARPASWVIVAVFVAIVVAFTCIAQALIS